MTTSSSRTIAQVEPQLYERTLTVNGVSKAYCMTGWRIGYGGGPVPLIKAMGKMQSQSTSNPCSISQAAAIEALNGPQDFIAEHNKSFKERRDLVVDMLNKAPGLALPPAGGRLLRLSRPAPARSASARRRARRSRPTTISSTYLLEAEGVAVVQGSAFGLSPFFRISYATSTEALREACTPHPARLPGAAIGSAGV